MTSSIVKPSEYNIEKLTFNPLMNQKKKTAQTTRIMVPGAPLSNYLLSTLICMVFRQSVTFIRRIGKGFFLKLPLK